LDSATRKRRGWNVAVRILTIRGYRRKKIEECLIVERSGLINPSHSALEVFITLHRVGDKLSKRWVFKATPPSVKLKLSLRSVDSSV
jgi:hypothetical protein